MLTILDDSGDVETLEWNGGSWDVSWVMHETSSSDTYWNAWFTYDYRPDSVTDRSTYENNGRMEISMDETDWVPGRFGSAIDFDGSDDYVDMGDPSSGILDFGASADFTVSAWVKTTQAAVAGNEYPMIVNKATGGGSGYGYQLILHNDTGDPRWYGQITSNGTNYTCFGDNDIADGSWHHITLTRSGSNTYCYEDGVQTDTASGASATIATTAAFRVGVSNLGSPWNYNLDGIVDDVRVYNYARNSGQVVEDMNAGHPAPGSPVGSSVLHLKFDEGYGDVAYDSGIGGNNGDLGGSGQSCPGDVNTSCPWWTNNGIYGKALDFETSGTQDYIDLGNPTDLQITGAVTLSAWVKHESLNHNTRYITKGGSSGSRGWELSFEGDSTDQVFFTISSNGTTEYSAETNFSLTAGVWYHFVGVYEPSTAVKLYVNGVLNAKNRVSIPASQYNTSYNVYISNRASCGNCYMDGIIDEIRVYNSALSASQVNILYNQGSAAVWGAKSTDSSGNASWSAADEYCPPGQGSTCNPPIAEWKFDENTGTGDGSVNDTSGNGYIFDMEPTMSESDWVSGRFGSALDFDGDDDFVINDSSGGLTITDTVTLSAWVKADTHDGTIVYQGHNDGGYNNYDLEIEPTGVLEFSYKNSGGSSNDFTSSSTYTWTDGWHYIAASHTYGSRSTAKLYRDGVEIVGTWTNGDGDDAPFTHNYASVGERGYGTGNSDHFDGVIDEVKIYDYIRTQAQIAWEYNQGAPVGWWKFDECEGTTAYDSGSGGNNGTITIGATGDNTSAGTCSSGAGNEAWDNGTNGKRNASLDLDGTNDIITITDNTIHEPENITIMAWINMDVLVDEWVISKQQSGASVNYGYMMRIRDPQLTHACDFGYGSGSVAVGYSNTNNIAVGSWYYLTCTYDGTTGKAYVNGQLVESVTDGTNAIDYTSVGDLHIGERSDSTQRFNGLIDDVRVYNYVLTPEQIRGIISEGALRFGPDTGSP